MGKQPFKQPPKKSFGEEMAAKIKQGLTSINNALDKGQTPLGSSNLFGSASAPKNKTTK